MRATALEVAEPTALVELRPCWLARLFGARVVRVELERVQRGWVARDTEQGVALRRVLDAMLADQLPRATARIL